MFSFGYSACFCMCFFYLRPVILLLRFLISFWLYFYPIIQHAISSAIGIIMLSVTLCTVDKQYILHQKYLNKTIGTWQYNCTTLNSLNLCKLPIPKKISSSEIAMVSYHYSRPCSTNGYLSNRGLEFSCQCKWLPGKTAMKCIEQHVKLYSLIPTDYLVSYTVMNM